MTSFQARMMDAATGGEAVYAFEAEADLVHDTPVRIIRKFMEHVHHDLIPETYKDYELNAAFKNQEAQVVTGLGSLILQHKPPIPFAVMISPSRNGEAA